MRRNNKDILLGLVGTLTDEECKEAYYLLKGTNKTPYDFLTFDKVKLTQGQYNKLIWLWGKDKTEACINILNDWLIKKGDKVRPTISHYKNIMGWVEGVYYTKYPANDKSLRFNSSIDTAWKAKRYVKRIPPELRAYDTEIKFLIEKFGTDILNV